jgi:hypothetical protein
VSVRVTGHQQAAAKLGQWDKKFQRNLLVMVGAFAGRLEAKAVQDRPWTDRTNAARNSITGSYDQIPGGMIVALAIGVEYGKYLELSRGGKYRVIRPTVDAMRREFSHLPKDAMKVTHV